MLKKSYSKIHYYSNGSISRSFIKIVTCIIIITFFGSLFHTYKQRPTKNITIFIHGTLMPFLALLNPLKTYTQTIKPNDWYYKCLQTIRGDADILNDSIILEEGLKKIDPLILYQCSKLHSSLTKNGLPGKGAYQAIGAYDMISKIINNQQDNSSYYTFGFNGILSHAHRKEASLKFYEEINKLVSDCLKAGFKPIINLCGYSHGGNLILLLAHAELIHKQNLQIDKVILYGTPIQVETAIYANHPMFSRIYNFFSEGDNIQNSDSFSTSSASSFRTFKELCKVHNLEILSKNIHDIRLLVGESPTVLGHFSYWFFNKYSDSWTNTHPVPAQSVLNAISPFPIAVFTPLFLNLMEQCRNIDLNEIDINFRASDQLLEIQILDSLTKRQLKKSENIASIFSKIKRCTGDLNSDSTNSNISILKNLGASISTIIKSIIE